jgi:hypothetical protein
MDVHICTAEQNIHMHAYRRRAVVGEEAVEAAEDNTYIHIHTYICIHQVPCSGRGRSCWGGRGQHTYTYIHTHTYTYIRRRVVVGEEAVEAAEDKMGRYYKTPLVDLTHQPKDRIVPAEDADYNNVRSEYCVFVCMFYMYTYIYIYVYIYIMFPRRK